mmetsp:Transcript_35389/g.75443  ORF Transcript_35389/g.75443 Transcript_35389/m.75443 type:complete len:233 (-) Transcript_35389:125-823(-)
MQSSSSSSSAAEASKAKWRKAKGWPMADSARDTLAVAVDGTTMNAADVALYEAGAPLSDPDLVCLELLYVGIPKDFEEAKFESPFKEKLTNVVQELRRSEFRRQLSRHKDATLRRRKEQNEVTEGGDASEEKWREFLRKPPLDPRLTVTSVFEAGSRVRRVLGLRVTLSAQASDELGKLCFTHIFEDEDDIDPTKKWYEDPFLSSFYICFGIVILVFFMWFCLLASAIWKHQ